MVGLPGRAVSVRTLNTSDSTPSRFWSGWGVEWNNMVWYGMVWYGLVCNGYKLYGMVCSAESDGVT